MQKNQPHLPQVEWAKRYLLDVLERADEPIVRDKLAIMVKNNLPEGASIPLSSVERITRAALAALVVDGVPVMSTGKGFAIMKDKAMRERAASILEKTASSLMRRAHAYRSYPQKVLF